MKIPDISSLLEDYIKPLEPVKTDTEPSIDTMTEIKSVIFDIYGTLIISAAGEISVHENKTEDKYINMDKKAFSVPEKFSFRDAFYSSVKQYHSDKKETGFQFPEVNVIDIWDNILTSLVNDKKRFSRAEWESLVEYVSIQFEIINNPVWIMPSAQKILKKLSDNAIRTGIISNAQFYTPVILKHLLGINDLNEAGFSEELCVWSWVEGIGKPDPRLFNKAAENAEKAGIQRNEILYVGNDMYNDIYAANRAGFRTCLFAGDKRSLRLRSDLSECMNLKADIIISNLDQITDILELE